ncbi:MAG: hypothetical protein IT208_12460 [Chthonomonadales bacterium]|nr:hypothetical protein [Chthonomonadales bacterium]
MQHRTHHEQQLAVPVVRPAEDAGPSPAAGLEPAADEADRLLESFARLSRRRTGYRGACAALGGALAGLSAIIGAALLVSPPAGALRVVLGQDISVGLLSWGAPRGHGWPGWSWLLPLAALAVCALGAALTRRECARIARVAQRLAREGDLRAIGPLLEALYLPGRALREDVAEGLARLLPRVGPEDRPPLDDRQRRLLRRCLERPPIEAVGLCAPILDACRHVGDGSEAAAAERLSRGEGPARGDARARAAALGYLEAMARRVERMCQAATLLRPRELRALLRPAGPGEADHSALLRPHGNDGPAPTA